MTKYIKQPTHYSCGPTALYNLLLWANCIQKSLTFRKLHQMCNCELPLGTQFEQFNSTLRQICSSTKIKLVDLIFKPNFQQITSHLICGGVVLLEFHWEDGDDSGEHYVLLTQKTSKGIEVINSDESKDKKKIIEVMSDRKIKTMLQPFEYLTNEKYNNINDRIYPKAWLLCK